MAEKENKVKDAEEKLTEINLKKQPQSREERSTECFYDRRYWGEEYQTRFNTTFEKGDKQVCKETGKKIHYINRYFPNIKSALDVGCSFGHLVAGLREKKIDAWGIDISEAAFDKASKEVRPFLKIVNVKDMKIFEDNSFELVTAFDMMEHLYIEEIMTARDEISRVASKHILIRVPSASYSAEPWLADISYKIVDKDHVSIYPVDFWIRRFIECGKFSWRFTYSYDSWNTGDYVESWIVFERK